MIAFVLYFNNILSDFTFVFYIKINKFDLERKNNVVLFKKIKTKLN